MKSQKRIIFYLLLLALIPRAISLATFDFIDSGGGSDSVTYIALARNLFTGRGYTEFGLPHTVHHPFYPVTIGLVWQLTGDLLFSAQLIACLAGILVVIPVYKLAESLFGRRTGVLAGLAAAIFPILVYGSTESFSESLYTLLLISGLAAGWLTFRSGGIFRPLLSGAFLGLAFLTHPLGVVFLPLVAGFNLLAGRHRSWTRERLRASILIVLAFCLTALPFWLFLRSATGRWQLSGSSHYQDFGLRYDQSRGVPESQVIFSHMEELFQPDLRPSADPDYRPIGMAELIFRHPGRFIQIIRFNIEDGYGEAVKTARYLSLSPRVFLALIGSGALLLTVVFIFSLIRPGRRGEVNYLALTFLPLGVFLVLQVEHRYFYPFIPAALIAFSAILERIWWWAEKRPALRRPLFFALMVYFLALATASGLLVYRKARKISVPYEYKILGTWMRQNVPGIEEERVMMFRLGVSYYAGCDWNVFYWGDLAGLKGYLRERSIRYLVVDSYKLHMLHPELRFLLDADPLPEGFYLIREIGYDGRKARLLKFEY